MTNTHSTAQLVHIDVPSTDAKIAAVEIDGQPMVAFKPLCEAIGVAQQKQAEKLRRRSWATVTPRVVVAADGKAREMLMIDQRTMTMWLATLDENRVSDEARPVVIAFQAEAADALHKYFRDGRAENPRGTALSTFDILRCADRPARSRATHCERSKSHRSHHRSATRCHRRTPRLVLRARIREGEWTQHQQGVPREDRAAGVDDRQGSRH